MTDNFRNPARMTAEERQLKGTVRALGVDWPAPRIEPQPITHAAILAAVKRLPDNLDGPAAIADALCAQLGVDVPVKRAPWEVAFSAWLRTDPADGIDVAWQAAVEWCVEQIADAHGFTPHDVRDTIRRRIMGEQP